MPASSAPPEFNAMALGIDDQGLIGRAPFRQTPPPAERLVSRHPARSASTQARGTVPSFCQKNGRRPHISEAGAVLPAPRPP
eukprot:9933964-Alexandrium_andersonii.AAC.1